MSPRRNLSLKKRIVVKVGTSSLSHPGGRLNFHQIERIAHVLSKIRAAGREVVLVTSGSIGVGAGRLGLTKKPEELAQKQALAAVGQAELIKIYQKFFDENNQKVAQVLLTKDVITHEVRHKNAQSTLWKLLEMGIIPIINENDTISVFEIEKTVNFGDNDTLSAIVATLIKADLLIILSDIDGLYSSDPKMNNKADIIHTVYDLTPEIEKLASGTGSSFATGGMVTKLQAAEICRKAHIDTIITNGSKPDILFEILEGKEIGTLFVPNNSME
jgi:glutamate 5-kinase